MITDLPDFDLVNKTYPMFGGSIQRLRGGKEFVTYIKDLISSANSPTAGSFQVDVLDALNRLAAQHNKDYAHLFPGVDLWTQLSG